MMEYKYLIPPLAGAFIGWLTNYIAIKLLFRPHNPIKLFGMNVQGIVPKRRKEIARGIAKTVEAELLSSTDIADALEGMDWKSEIEKGVRDIIDGRFRHINKIPIIGLVSEEISDRVKYIVAKDILIHINAKKGDFAKKFTEKVDVEEMLASKIDALDLKKFEGLLTDFVATELRHIEWLGGVMGFLIGVGQSAILYFMP